MKKIIVLTLMIISMCVTSAYSQSFIVVEIMENLSTVILRDQDTGQEWVAEKGEMIEGWTVEEISKSYVTISKPCDNDTLLMTQIPAPSIIHATQQGQ